MPYRCNNLHHEIELGVVIGKNSNGDVIPKDRAMDFMSGYCLALDMTARDLQNEMKDKRLPWSIAKVRLHFGTWCFAPETDIPKHVFRNAI